MKTKYPHIILFDGLCNLCNGSVQFIINKDHQKLFKFASLQGEFGQNLLQKHHLHPSDFNSIIYVKGQHIFIKSTAVLMLLKELKKPWSWLYIFIYVPRFIRDFLYDIIAKSRYRIFGKREVCMMPSQELENRFL